MLPSLGSTPTLLLWGEQDAVHPVSYGQLCRDDIPGAQFVTVSGGSHLLPTRAPQRVAEELSAFFPDALSATRAVPDDEPDEALETAES